jgi:predicted Fe-Mo cluster-binding NifX family protein
MRIAVASNGLNVADNFSTCLNFNFFDTSAYEIVDTRNVPADELTSDERIILLDRLDADALVCGNLRTDTEDELARRQVAVASGFHGSAYDAAETYVNKRAEELLADVPQEDDE